MPHSSIKRVFRALWLIAIFITVVGSLLPSESRSIQILATLPIGDKIEHFATYAVLAFLPAIHERRGFIVAAAISAVALGIALEFGQLYSGWRDFDIGDMLADVAGVCLGVALGISMRSAAARALFSGSD